MELTSLDGHLTAWRIDGVWHVWDTCYGPVDPRGKLQPLLNEWPWWATTEAHNDLLKQVVEFETAEAVTNKWFEEDLRRCAQRCRIYR